MIYLSEYFDGCKLLYEPMVFRLPSGNYTPDWMVRREDGTIVFIEVKGRGGFDAHQSGRSSRKSLKEAAYHYDWLGEWIVLVKAGPDTWDWETL
jgi:hypothetical protein